MFTSSLIPKEKVTFMFVAVILVLTAQFSGGCCPGCAPPVVQAPPPACQCPISETQVIDCSDGSQVIINSGTNITPCNCMQADYIPPNDLPDQNCMPKGNVITAIDVWPDGVQFTPEAKLHFKLPASHPYKAGYKLTIWQHTSGTCDKSAGQTNWKAEPGTAKVDSAEDFADGPMRHTTIFALVEMVSQFNAYAQLATPFEGFDNGISFGVQINDSFSNPEMEAAEFTIVITGLEVEDPNQLVDELNNSIPIGSPIAVQFDSNLFTIWSDSYIREFYAAALDVYPGLPQP